MFKKLAKQLNIMNNKSSSCIPVSKPFMSQKYDAQKSFLDRLSKHALAEYEKKMTVKKFTKLALSDSDDLSHEVLIDKLLDSGEVKDLSDSKNITNLAYNNKLLKDLELY